MRMLRSGGHWVAQGVKLYLLMCVILIAGELVGLTVLAGLVVIGVPESLYLDLAFAALPALLGWIMYWRWRRRSVVH